MVAVALSFAVSSTAGLLVFLTRSLGVGLFTTDKHVEGRGQPRCLCSSVSCVKFVFFGGGEESQWVRWVRLWRPVGPVGGTARTILILVACTQRLLGQ